ncbi:hypothetical protein [Nonomuraea sp. NPDC049309]|uniref:hypothetical protein n=1 Tax=Nonomuraea sp. NPDC049309 TaxID=3364350 RepID=UPI00370F91A9
MEVPTWLRPATTTDLYRDNAFRISGLPVTATSREVRRRATQVRAAESLGAGRAGPPAAPEARWLPLKPAPDHDAVREALRRLEDPVRRVVDEFFWFWPLAETDGIGLDRAKQTWKRLAEQDPEAGAEDSAARSIALHNLAVAGHAKAVEAESHQSITVRHALWRQAYRQWRMVLDDEGCWRWLDERIRALDDPRLRAVSSGAFREALPAALVEAHAGVAVQDARRWGGEKAASGHVSLMRDFAADEELLDAVLRRATAPTVAALRHRAETAADPRDEPAVLERAAASLLTGSEPDLRVLRAVLGKAHPVWCGAADALATAVSGCAVACANGLVLDGQDASGMLAKAAAHLRAARRLAAGRHVRAMIADNLVTLLGNDLLLACDKALKRVNAAPESGHAEAVRLLKTTEDRLREVRVLRPDGAETEQLHDSVALTACRLLNDYFDATQNMEQTLQGYRKALAVVASSEGQAVIMENITTLSRALELLGDRARPAQQIPALTPPPWSATPPQRPAPRQPDEPRQGWGSLVGWWVGTIALGILAAVYWKNEMYVLAVIFGIGAFLAAIWP